MMVARRALPAIAAVALSAGPVPAQTESSAAQTSASNDAEASDNEIVVSVFRNTAPLRCLQLEDDPQDLANARPRFGEPRRQSVLVELRNGGYALEPDMHQMPDGVWHRAGTAIEDYTFRAPTDGSPLCIGSKRLPNGYGQLRMTVGAKPYWGKRMRFTAWIATNNAHWVRFWFASGTESDRRVEVVNGGNTNNNTITGTHGWTPVMIEMGPVGRSAELLSYGFLLHGRGDVWLYNPKIEVIADGDPTARGKEVSVIGIEEK